MFKATEEPITLHGLGFLQVKLQGNQRLHIWHPALPRRECFVHSSIHNHRFGFNSHVLVGTQINVDYKVWADLAYGRPTHIGYLHEGERTKFGNRPWLPDMEVRVQERHRRTIPAGGQYTMFPYEFHSTVPGGDGRVATVMKKTDEGDIGAHSLCLIGVQPDADFDRKQWAEDRLWEVVRDVIGGQRIDAAREQANG